MAKPKKLNIASLFGSLQSTMEASQLLQREHSIHKGETGEATEYLWIKLLRDYLPTRYEIDKGFAVDHKGNCSQQQDLIIFDRQYSPFVLNEDGLIYIPAESIYAVFEVKQDLTKAHLEYAGDKAASVRKLIRTSTSITHAGGKFAPRPPFPIPAGLLTLTSTWTDPLGTTFNNHFCRIAKKEATQLQLGCTLDGGGYRLVTGKNGKHQLIKSRPEISLMYFLLTLFHTLQQLGTVSAIDVTAYLKSLE